MSENRTTEEEQRRQRLDAAAKQREKINVDWKMIFDNIREGMEEERRKQRRSERIAMTITAPIVTLVAVLVGMLIADLIMNYPWQTLIVFVLTSIVSAGAWILSGRYIDKT